MNPNSSAKAGTIGGTLLTVFYNIKSEDVVKTIVLASIGAVVSFVVSLLLKAIFKKSKK
ncbi:MAG: hypothetical protein ACOVO1_01375 [Chitinophagaceae bacterium]